MPQLAAHLNNFGNQKKVLSFGKIESKEKFYLLMVMGQSAANWCQSQPQTRQTPDTSDLRHIIHQTSDKEHRAANYTTDKNIFSYFN